MKITNTTPSATEPYVLIDKHKIPDEIKNMPKEERLREIARLEAEGRRERDRIRREKLDRENKAV